MVYFCVSVAKIPESNLKERKFYLSCHIKGVSSSCPRRHGKTHQFTPCPESREEHTRRNLGKGVPSDLPSGEVGHWVPYLLPFLPPSNAVTS